MFPHQVQSSIIIWSPPRGEVVIFSFSGTTIKVVFLVWNSFRATQKLAFSLFLLVGAAETQAILKGTSNLLLEEKVLLLRELYVRLQLLDLRSLRLNRGKQTLRNKRELRLFHNLINSVITNLGDLVLIHRQLHLHLVRKDLRLFYSWEQQIQPIRTTLVLLTT